MKFKFHGIELEGFDHEYNDTKLNERRVEIPIAELFLAGVGARAGETGEAPAVLEVGNVLSHYGLAEPIAGGTYRIVDLFEVAEGVENVDLFDIEGEYDAIVSISTIEHVGWEGQPEDLDPGAAIAALEHLRGLLAPGGQLLVTVPTGYHLPLDEVLLSGESGAARECTLVRTKRAGGWTQTDELEQRPYADPTPWAHSVWVGEFE
jgi:hypothetical protein